MSPDINKILDQRSIRTANTSRAKKTHFCEKDLHLLEEHLLAIKTNFVYIFHLHANKMPSFKKSLEHLLTVKTNFVYIFHLHTTNMPSFKKFLRASLVNQDQFRFYFPSPHQKKAID